MQVVFLLYLMYAVPGMVCVLRDSSYSDDQDISSEDLDHMEEVERLAKFVMLQQENLEESIRSRGQSGT